MAEIVKMPKLSDTMTEGVVAKWHKKVGDVVKEGDLLAEIETDKATMEYESFQEGVLLHLGVAEGKAVPVDSIMAILGKQGENFDNLLKPSSKGETNSVELPIEKSAKSVSNSFAKPDIKASVIRMPKLSDTMTEGTVAKWHKKIGDAVKSGELLAEIETDKATMEFEAYEEGTLLHIGVTEGKSAAVDTILAIVGEKGSDFQKLIEFESTNAKNTVEDKKPETVPVIKPTAASEKKSASTAQSTSNERIIASPLAKKLAEEKGISIQSISGTGEGGRIIKRDVENFSGNGSVRMDLMVERYVDKDISQMRKTIAKRLSESKFQAPHFYLTISLDMNRAIEARIAINSQIEGKISFNDMVIKAAALALKAHPNVNVSWMGDSIRYYEHAHIGVAVAVEEGLLVPVIRHANAKSFQQIGTEVRTLADKAKNKTLQPAEWEGSTFTISNLGMFGIEEFTAIVNPPNACILAVGAINEVPVVKAGQIVPGNVMKVTLSCDHRVVDGAKGAEFLKTFKKFIEDPITMFI